MRSFKRLAVLSAILGAGCGPKPASENPACRVYREHHYQDQFKDRRYEVGPVTLSSSGISVDTSGLPFDPADKIDRQTDEVETCLRETYGSPPRIPEDVRRAADCDSETFPLPLLRECLTVKVAADWIPSTIDGQQLLPFRAPPQLCYDKGLCRGADGTLDSDCPCYWRVGIQDNRVIVITPSAYLYKDALIRLVTGCNNPWVGPHARCADPTVPPK